MFNNQQYNTNTRWAIVPIASSQVVWNIVYNGYVLHKRNDVYVSFIDAKNAPDISPEIFNIPNSDGVWVLDYKYRQRSVRVEGTIVKDNAQEVRKEVDEMKKFLWEPWKVLQVVFDWVPRRATAYMNNIEFSQEHFNTYWTKFTIEFIVIDPFWRNVGTITNTFSDITATFNENEVNRWWVLTDVVMTLTFTSATSVNELSVTMWDGWIEINTAISANDIVRIDWENKVVTLNGNSIEYTGVIPQLELGNNPYTITVNGTYNYTLNIQHSLQFI